jgi:hypothetical protein
VQRESRSFGPKRLQVHPKFQEKRFHGEIETPWFDLLSEGLPVVLLYDNPSLILNAAGEFAILKTLLMIARSVIEKRSMVDAIIIE